MNIYFWLTYLWGNWDICSMCPILQPRPKGQWPSRVFFRHGIRENTTGQARPDKYISAHITSMSIPLAKASHMAKLDGNNREVHITKRPWAMWMHNPTKGEERTGTNNPITTLSKQSWKVGIRLYSFLTAEKVEPPEFKSFIQVG